MLIVYSNAEAFVKKQSAVEYLSTLYRRKNQKRRGTSARFGCMGTKSGEGVGLVFAGRNSDFNGDALPASVEGVFTENSIGSAEVFVGECSRKARRVGFGLTAVRVGCPKDMPLLSVSIKLVVTVKVCDNSHGDGVF